LKILSCLIICSQALLCWRLPLEEASEHCSLDNKGNIFCIHSVIMLTISFFSTNYCDSNYAIALHISFWYLTSWDPKGFHGFHLYNVFNMICDMMYLILCVYVYILYMFFVWYFDTNHFCCLVIIVMVNSSEDNKWT